MQFERQDAEPARQRGTPRPSVSTLGRTLASLQLQTPAGNRATAQFSQDVRGVEDRDVESAAPGPVLVEDSVMDAAPGQMRRSEFLELLHAEVCRTAEDALRGTMFAAAGCPWIDHWFA